MKFLKIFSYFRFLFGNKLGLSFYSSRRHGFPLVKNARVFGFLFDVFFDEGEEVVEICTIICDVTFNLHKPSLFKYKYIYRNKRKIKIFIVQSILGDEYISFCFLVGEIFCFVVPRYFFSLGRRLYFTNYVTGGFNSIFFNFTFSAYLFFYLLEEVDPNVLRDIKINFSLFSGFLFSPFFLRLSCFFQSFLFFFFCKFNDGQNRIV